MSTAHPAVINEVERILSEHSRIDRAPHAIEAETCHLK
jgi:hypothetical protein